MDSDNNTQHGWIALGHNDRHYFVDGKSLCGRYGGRFDWPLDGDDKRSGNCEVCKRRRAAEVDLIDTFCTVLNVTTGITRRENGRVAYWVAKRSEK